MIKHIVDQLDREKIENNLYQTFLVEAGAGSGKTTSLVNRMVNIIRTGVYQINEIVAITFTKKAAEELKTRFQMKVEKEWKKENDEAEKQLLEHALNNIDQCFIGTVHSFCAQLLRERPIEAGLDLMFQEIEDVDDNAIAQQAWNIYFEQLRLSDPITYKKINDLGIPIDELMKSFIKMKSFPDANWVYETKRVPNIHPIFQSFIQLLNEAKHAIPTEPIEGRYDELQELILHGIRKQRYENMMKDSKKIQILELFTKKLKIVQKLWTSKEDAKHYLEKISELIETQCKPLLIEWYEYVHGEIIPLMRNVMEQYKVLKEKGSYVNYQDLLMKVAELLKENIEVRESFQQKYRCILVDEFQDTDPIQAEIMFYLTADDSTEKDWTRCKPKPGSLFVVGDPKQAIYRFRRADIDIYNKVKALIIRHGGEVLNLTMNFRTLDSVSRQLNAVFEQKLPARENTYQAAFKPLNSFFEDDHSSFSGIHQIVIPKEYTHKESIIQYESEQIAQMIKGMLLNGHRPNEFMILTRYNENLDVYYRALLEENIPAVMSGEVIFGDIEIFQELCHLLQFVEDPNNQIKLLAVLRGSFFGISDQQLFDWKQAGGRFTIYSVTNGTLDEHTKKIFRVAFEKLRNFVEWKCQFSPITTIEKIILDIGFYPSLILNGHGKKEFQALQQSIEKVRQTVTYKEAVAQLTECIFSPTSGVNMYDNEESVRIMNVHKSKGLEAEIVILANPAKNVNIENRIDYHIKRTKTGARGYFIFKKPYGYIPKTVAQPTAWMDYQAEEYQYLLEEETRILYVAATRAEKALIISNSEKHSNKNPWKDLITIVKPNTIEIERIEEKEERVNQTVSIVEQDESTLMENVRWGETQTNPSYATYSPSDVKQDISTIEIKREEGGGVAWGTMIHEVFERLVKGSSVENQLEAILTKHGISHDRLVEVFQVIDQFKLTEIWEQINQAEQVLTEAPFTIKITEDDPLYEQIGKNVKRNQPFFVKGIIDLVYRYEGNWYIVDYKTDRPKDKRDLLVLTTYYEHQISFYRDVWERITGTKVKNALLYFVTWDEICLL